MSRSWRKREDSRAWKTKLPWNIWRIWRDYICSEWPELVEWEPITKEGDTFWRLLRENILRVRAVLASLSAAEMSLKNKHWAGRWASSYNVKAWKHESVLLNSSSGPQVSVIGRICNWKKQIRFWSLPVHKKCPCSKAPTNTFILWHLECILCFLPPKYRVPGSHGRCSKCMASSFMIKTEPCSC